MEDWWQPNGLPSLNKEFTYLLTYLHHRRLCTEVYIFLIFALKHSMGTRSNSFIKANVNLRSY